MKTVKFTQMKTGTKDEYLLLDRYEQANIELAKTLIPVYGKMYR